MCKGIFYNLVFAVILVAQLSVDALAVSPVKPEPGIKILSDLHYSSQNNPSQSLDLYLPDIKPAKLLPLVIFIHGGGWRAGTKSDPDGVCKEFVRRGFACASLNYRLSKEAAWPAQAIDCKSAVRWLRANAQTYSLDVKRFAVGGHSAGGHLSAFLAVTNGVKKFDQGENLKYSSAVQAELWFAGVADLVSRARAPGYEKEQSANSGESRLLGHPVLQDKKSALEASPVTWVSKSAVPFFFEAGTADDAVPPGQVTEMKAALDQYGIYSEVHFLPGVGHIGRQFFDREHFDLIDAFLRRVLKIQNLH